MAGENTLNDVVYTDENIIGNNQFNSNPKQPGEEYDFIFSFFKKIMKDDTAAGTFTDSLYEISRITNISVLALLETMKGLDEISVNSTMAYYLNGVRDPSTLVGIQNPVIPNFYAGRNVLG